MTRYFRKGRQTSKLSLRTLLLLAIAGAATAGYDCSNSAPHAPLEENKLRTQTSPPHTFIVMQDRKIIYQGQTPSHLWLRPGNYVIIVMGRTFSLLTVAMAYYADGSWTSTSTCLLVNPRATIRLTMLNNANTTAHLISRNPHDGTQLTHSLVVFSIVFQPPLQVNRSAAGQPSTAPYNTVNATSGATITGTPAPHLANGTTTAWQDQAGTTPAGDDFSVPAHNCTAGAGRKGCVSDQPSVASATNEQPANATASSPEVSSSTGAIVGGAIGSVVAVAIIVLLSICGWQRWKDG